MLFPFNIRQGINKRNRSYTREKENGFTLNRKPIRRYEEDEEHGILFSVRF